MNVISGKRRIKKSNGNVTGSLIARARSNATATGAALPGLNGYLQLSDNIGEYWMIRVHLRLPAGRRERPLSLRIKEQSLTPGCSRPR